MIYRSPRALKTIESQNLKARVDAFNAFNIASYGEPDTYIGGSVGSFGADYRYRLRTTEDGVIAGLPVLTALLLQV